MNTTPARPLFSVTHASRKSPHKVTPLRSEPHILAPMRSKLRQKDERIPAHHLTDQTAVFEIVQHGTGHGRRKALYPRFDLPHWADTAGVLIRRSISAAMRDVDRRRARSMNGSFLLPALFTRSCRFRHAATHYQQLLAPPVPRSCCNHC